VFEGARIIVGDGRAPIENATLVVDGTRITQVGAAAAVSVPAGATLVLNKISAAPGFWLGNVIVMAGIPSVMQAMLDYVAPQLKTGAKMLSESIRADCREGDIGTELGMIAQKHADVVIGSYPFMDEKNLANTNVVVRSRDLQKLTAAKHAIESMLERVRAALAK